MKKLVFFISAVFAAQIIFADEIYLKDNTVLKGTIIQITKDKVEYDPDGPEAFDTVLKDQVAKIVYPGGKQVTFVVDTLYLTSGEAVKGAVKRVTKDIIVYTPEGSNDEKTVPRAQISRIEFSDGKTADMSVATDEGGADTSAVKALRGYADSIIRIAVFGGGGTMLKGIAEKERRVFRAYKPDLMLSYPIPWDYGIYNGFATCGADLDVMFPAIKFPQKRGFDFTGLKFGVKGRYGYVWGQSVITRWNEDGAEDGRGNVGNDSVFTGKTLDYHYWGAGPSVNFIFSPRNNIVSVIINMYAVGGQVFGGHLSAGSALRDADLLMLRLAGAWNGVWNVSPFMREANILTLSGLNKTRVRGYTIRGGFGPEISLNKHFPLIVGFHVTYAYTNLKMGRALALYADGNKKTAQHEVGGDVSVGVHF